MAVSDLTNTTWVLNSTLSSDSIAFQINFKLYHGEVLQSSDRKYLYGIADDSGTVTYYAYPEATDGGPDYTKYQFVYPGDTIIITGGQAVKNRNLISWLNKNATQVIAEPIKIECSVEYDDEWIQQDCHWEVRRFFRLVFNINNPDVYQIQLFCRFDKEPISDLTFDTPNKDSTTGKYGKYIYLSTTNDNCFSKSTARGWKYIYELGFIEPEEIYQELINNRHEDGHITVTAYITALDKSGSHIEAHSSLRYYLQLPAEGPITELSTYRPVISPNEEEYPGDFVCEWNLVSPPTENEADSVDGYCIELDHKPEDAEEFSRVLGLKVDRWTEEPRSYYLTYDEGANNPEAYLELDADDDYTPNEDGTTKTIKLYFTPEDVGVKNGEYRFNIFPYNIYSHHEDYENGNLNGYCGPSALLSSDSGLDKPVIEVPKGIVRVMTEDGWKEGKVWVYTEGGWKEAYAVFTYTDEGWKESI
jgi:hypothetical protein